MYPYVHLSNATYEEPNEHLISGHHWFCTERLSLSRPHWTRNRRRRPSLLGCIWAVRSIQYEGQTNGPPVRCHGLYIVTICFQVVVKQFPGDYYQKSPTARRVLREVTAWWHLSHPNVAKIFGIAYLDPGQHPGIVSQYMRQNDILAYLGRHPELMQQMVRLTSNFWHRNGHTLIQVNNHSGLRNCNGAAISA